MIIERKIIKNKWQEVEICLSECLVKFNYLVT